MFKVGDLACWLPYGPEGGPPKGATVCYEMPLPRFPKAGPPLFVVGVVEKANTLGQPTLLREPNGRVWDPTVCPTWLFHAKAGLKEYYEHRYGQTDEERAGSAIDRD